MLLGCPQSSIQNPWITLAGYTDIGTINMLSNVAGGLPIFTSSAENRNENWQYVSPAPGCALVNIGDSMVEYCRARSIVLSLRQGNERALRVIRV